MRSGSGRANTCVPLFYPLGRAFELSFEIEIFQVGARDFFVIGCDKFESGRLPELGYLQLFFFGHTGIFDLAT
jgi:hypothetical protein